ncbi:hypothetical protein EIN_201580 [Entamoeba invadens IP1]|uniref:ShKT domain-containing protein n=1 Tax=Entamoeba invadens IP1 TaxID=370355 RepID=A0A0A1U5P4_ENTIV|nr:hypothetical protein EIN_201580 [Entamoeba invadens IP1]ELP89633.1 hypothetical protein EIN_201580 [Entamoeba invadens IP1]|eukprot:XP_004256404.1 hypothetical protein EIN_201580 [Entamoeba invadens IP1]
MSLAFYIFITVCLPTLCVGAISTPVCMSDFMAVNMNSVDITYDLISDCFALIPDSAYSVRGKNLNSDCYIDNQYLYIDKNGSRISRCGQWLEVVGPTKTKVICMVAGSVKPFFRTLPFQPLITFVAMHSGLYTQVSGGFSLDTNAIVQTTVAETDFDLKVNPTLWVLSKTEKEAKVQVTDCNRPFEFLEIDNKIFGIQLDHTFTLPIYSTKVNINLVSFRYEKITFEDVELNNISKIVSNKRFETLQIENCEFLMSEILYTQADYVRHQLNSWFFYQFGDVSNFTTVTAKPPKFVPQKGDKRISIILINSTPMIFHEYFKDITFDFEANFNLVIGEINLYLVPGATNVKDFTRAQLIESNLKYVIYQNGTKVGLKFGFGTNNIQFSNCFVITFKCTEGQYVELTNAVFQKLEKIQKIKECNATALKCLDSECTVTNTSVDVGKYLWEKGCEPVCGNCRDGYVCTTMGKCILEKNDNLREGVESVMDFMFLIVGFVMLFII